MLHSGFPILVLCFTALLPVINAQGIVNYPTPLTGSRFVKANGTGDVCGVPPDGQKGVYDYARTQYIEYYDRNKNFTVRFQISKPADAGRMAIQISTSANATKFDRSVNLTVSPKIVVNGYMSYPYTFSPGGLMPADLVCKGERNLCLMRVLNLDTNDVGCFYFAVVMPAPYVPPVTAENYASLDPVPVDAYPRTYSLPAGTRFVIQQYYVTALIRNQKMPRNIKDVIAQMLKDYDDVASPRPDLWLSPTYMWEFFVPELRKMVGSDNMPSKIQFVTY